MKAFKRAFGISALLALLPTWSIAQPFPGTQPLTMEGDLAAKMVGGIDKYLDRVLADAPQNRARYWPRDISSPDALLKSDRPTSETNRVRLREILGVVDKREPVQMRFVAPVGTNVSPNSAEVGRGPGYRIYEVAWNVFRGVEGEGLLLQPDGEPKADIIAVPDCDWTPEQAIGLTSGVPTEQQLARRFAEAGCRVLVPCLIDRSDTFAGNPGVRSVKHSQRETLWRSSYEMGRTPIGYEVQKLLAAADWLDATRTAGPRTNDWQTMLKRIQSPGTCRQELGIIGYGEGGLLALYAGAVDARFLAVGVCGAFGLGQRNPELPLYRNVWSLLERFGDAELAVMIMPRALIVEHGKYPEVTHSDKDGGAPGKLWRPTSQEFQAESERFSRLMPEMPAYFLTAAADSVCDWGTAQRLYRKLASTGSIEEKLGTAPTATGSLPDNSARMKRQYLQIIEDTQWLMRESEYTRREFWKKADFKGLSGFTNSVQQYRDYFWDEVIGRLPKASLPPNARSRFLYETNGYRGYEVVLWDPLESTCRHASLSIL